MLGALHAAIFLVFTQQTLLPLFFSTAWPGSETGFHQLYVLLWVPRVVYITTRSLWRFTLAKVKPVSLATSPGFIYFLAVPARVVSGLPA